MFLSRPLLDELARAERIAVLTGAGISAESGLSTFRDPGGLWAQFRPEELASMDGFLANPQRVWEWYQYRRHVIETSVPNPAHRALAQMEKLIPDFTLITQNVDRLHQRAGSCRVLELHGNLEDNHCSQCGKPYIDEILPDDKTPPRCPVCGGLIRPSVVWFGEMLPYDVLQQAEHAARHAQVFFVIGTSAEVYPAAALPYIAWENGACLIEINPSTTPISSLAKGIVREKAGVALPRILEQMNAVRLNDGTE